jgi:RNA-binding protein
MPADSPPPRALGSRQRRHLKGLAQRLDAAVHVGEGGIGEGVLRALDEALRHHELVKVRMHRPADKRAMAVRLAEATGAELLALVGHTAVLFRANPEHPVVELPA